MNELLNVIRQFLWGLRLWVIVAPWEQAIRVRLGKRVTLLGPGVHLKVPLIDAVHVQTIRLRISGLGRQTVTNQSGVTLTFSVSVGYAIDNILTLYQTLHHAEDTIASLARGVIAEYIASHADTECGPEAIQQRAGAALDLKQFGLGPPTIYLSDFAIVRTYRIIGDYGNGFFGGALCTEKLPGAPPTA